MEKIVNKKILSLILAVFLSLSVLTGCNLITRNDELYYNATVATITYSDGTTDNITKRELITAYSSYGYNYVQNYGYTQKKAIETTLDSIVDNYFTRKAVKDYYAAKGENLFENSEKTYLWDQTMDAILSNLKGYLSETAKTSDETESTNKSIFVDYTKTVELEGTTLLRKTAATTIRGTYTARQVDGIDIDFEYRHTDGTYKFQELIYQNVQKLFAGNTQSDKNWKNAFRKYVDIVKENYEYLNKSSDKEWFLFEVNRVYDILKNNYIVEVYETIFNKDKAQDSRTTLVQARDVLDNYQRKVKTDYTTYKLQDDKETYASDMLSNIKDVYYYLEDTDSTNYFFIAPIKIDFSALSETQKNAIADAKALKEEGAIDDAQYKAKVNSIVNENSQIVNVRNASTGEVESHISITKLREKMEDAVLGAGHTDEEIAEALRKYFYLYNDEDTYKNADYNAVFGVDAEGNVVASDSYSDDDIKAAIKSLYNNGSAKIGDFSETVEVEDGFYIFLFAGKIENLVDAESASLTTETIKTLNKTRLNMFSQKTVLDVIFAELDVDNFSVFQNMDMNKLKKGSKTEKFVDSYKDLFNN